jgi:membrane protease YdiL (CAAX protease family)
MNIKSIIQRYPVAIYFFLAYAISWGGSFAIGGPKFLRGESLELTDGLKMAIPMLAGPCIAGLFMIILVDGKSGLRGLLSRMGKWRVGLRWYAAALFIFPFLILVVLLTLTTLGYTDFSPSFITFGILAGLSAGFFEEIGWMGFAYPKLQAKHETLRAVFILGFLHGLWHALAGYLGESQSYAEYWLPRFIVMWMISMTAMRIILVWIYVNTGSLLLAQLTHASSTGFLVILSPSPITPAAETLWWTMYAIVLWLVAFVILAKYGRQLVKPPERSNIGTLLSSGVNR